MTDLISYSEFEELAATGNVVPLVREVDAGGLTPIALAAELKRLGKFYLLESVENNERWGRYSILGFNIQKEFAIVDGQATLSVADSSTVLPGNPIDALQQYLKQFHVASVPEVPRFVGGAVGYLSFETVRFFERLELSRDDKASFPEAYFMISDELAVFDNLRKTIKLLCCVHLNEFDHLRHAYDHGVQALDRIGEQLARATTAESIARTDSADIDATSELRLTSNMTKGNYEDIVRKAKQYICDGDVIQVVLAQHFSTPIVSDSLDVYAALREINPSPYLYYLNMDAGKSIAGSSPEVMVRVTGNKAEIRPIAGTRPRGENDKEDAELAAELTADPKERAEHVMLVDLARNDLGRIADVGSVEVKDYMFIEKYSHVMHLVSQVEGRVRNDCDAIDVLKATFPAGTLTGAPKVRAMEIIEELEPIARGPYGGAIGYIGYGCDVMDLAITIRTVVVDNGTATVTAGAGIVYDSVPENEYMETLHKSNGMRRALEIAEANQAGDDR